MFSNFYNKIFKAKYLIRIDDIAPNMNWDVFFKVKNIFNKYKIKPILGVIPNNKDPDLLKFPVCEFDFFEEMHNMQSLGWKIAMHGYEHLYHRKTTKDYLNIGKKSEFVGKNYKNQNEMIKKGITILRKKSLDTNIFFAPGHSFDINTINSLKNNNFKFILDGYGLSPFKRHGIVFVPQLFNRLIKMPFGLFTSVLHLNDYNQEDLIRLDNFIKNNKNNIIDFDSALKIKNNLIYTLSALILKNILYIKRSIFS